MTNLEVIKKLDFLLENLDFPNYELADAWPEGIRQEIEYAITLPPKNTVIQPILKECLYIGRKEPCNNGFLKLIFDYYLSEYCFESALDDELEVCFNKLSRIIDLLCYKSIPYKNLMSGKLFDGNLSMLYYVTRADQSYANLIEYTHSSKGGAYSALLKILIKNKKLSLAEKIYKKHSFYISPKFLFVTAIECLKDDVQSFDRSFCQLLLTEFEKLNVSLHKVDDGVAAEKNTTPFECLSNEFINLIIKCFYLQAQPRFANGWCLNDALSLGLCLMEKSQAETHSIVSSFCTALESIINNKFQNDEEIMALLKRNRGDEEAFYDFGEDIVLFLNVFLLGINIVLLMDKKTNLNANTENFVENKFSPSVVNSLTSSYLSLDLKLKEFIADLLDLYVNIRNYRSDYLDIPKLTEFITAIEQRNEDLNEQYVESLMKSKFGALDDASIEKNCKIFFNSNHDSGNRITNVDELYKKLSNKEDIKKILSTGELLFLPYRELDDDILKGDLTGLVVCQIKAVERYLKEVIVQHAKNEKKDIVYYSKPDKKIVLVPKGSGGGKNYISVNDNTSALNLSDSSGNNCFSVEIGPCIAYIGSIPKLSKFARAPMRSVFNSDVNKSVLYKNWVCDIRNKHMHVVPIETLKEAREKLAKTAYWLLRIIDELIY